MRYSYSLGKPSKTGWDRELQVPRPQARSSSTLAAGGASLAQIAEVLNPKILQIVKRYSHLTEGNVAEILEKLDKEVFAQS